VSYLSALAFAIRGPSSSGAHAGAIIISSSCAFFLVAVRRQTGHPPLSFRYRQEVGCYARPALPEGPIGCDRNARRCASAGDLLVRS